MPPLHIAGSAQPPPPAPTPPPFDGRQSQPSSLLSFLCSRGLPLDHAVGAAIFPWEITGRCSKPRCAAWLLTVSLVGCMPCWLTWAVRAATDPVFNRPPPPLRVRQHTRRYARLLHPSRHHRPYHRLPRFRRLALQLRLRQRHAVPALQRHHRQRPVRQPQELPHCAVLRPLPPGGLPPVAPVRSLQQLPRALVPEKRQHAHRRKRRTVSPAIARAATTPSPCSPATCRRACPRSGRLKTKASPAPPATPSLRQTPPEPAATSWVRPAVLVDESGAPITAPSLRRRNPRPS